MELCKIILILTLTRHSYCGYTGYNILLWLSSDENVAPSDVWRDSSSTYNNGTNTTVNKLLKTDTRGYRNTFIDNWSSNPPDITRVTYRNKDGTIIFRVKFNSAGFSHTDWYNVSKARGGKWPALSYEFNHSYTSYSVGFTMSENSLDVLRYNAASLKLANGTVAFIVGEGRNFALLPASHTAPDDCYASYKDSNPFSVNITKTNISHIYCSAFCRERNYLHGGVHGETCSCLDAAASGPTLTACTEPCAGNSEEMCGGDLPPATIFNAVNTDIDASQFDQPLILMNEVQVNGETEEISYDWPIHLYGFNVTISPINLPASIRMSLHYRSQPCNGNNTWNSTYQKTFSVAAADSYSIFEIEPLFVQCVYISLYDNYTNNATTFPINMTTITIAKQSFVTAQFFTIEASWRTGIGIN
ncbi:uncharacterized protein LOC123537317 [Mercenaria mercenaria]|uniref:uncharacterized protein LOC123537317 n=1 Tax=Mercenaria mercenaria TaxID=6596 RepID=UPI00234EBD1A|nr:uncharacterized protein LOC123537317 [Mercenaria mercenaria]